MPLVTTDFRVPLEQIAGMLMSRWSQENFFKYMREEFNLDAMPVHDLAEQDPEAKVISRVGPQHPRRSATGATGSATCAAPWSGEKPTGEEAKGSCNAWRPSAPNREGSSRAHPDPLPMPCPAARSSSSTSSG